MSENDSGILNTIYENADTLSTILTRPQQFILGAVLTTVIEGLTGIVTEVLGAILTIFAGSQPMTFNGASEEKLGLADLPVLFAANVIDGGELVAGDIFAAITVINGGLFNLASSAGPLSGIIVTLVVVVEVVVALAALRLLAKVILDFVPGGGALSDYL